MALVHGSNEPQILDRLRLTHEKVLIEPLRNRLSGPDGDLRARLAASLAGGLLYALWVARDERSAAHRPPRPRRPLRRPPAGHPHSAALTVRTVRGPRRRGGRLPLCRAGDRGHPAGGAAWREW
ncbi:hypothetical protein ABZ079_31775 [Streptomyces sp. NPDC006314]|uniref:TetR/AcrR family transcriptional regulator n=1 Tax=Streptomyces sp. NPDC006314 TaxID=3154475 RepID=UPI0033ACF4FA